MGKNGRSGRDGILPDVQATASKFDEWALAGRADLMEKEHGYSVRAFLGTVRLGNRFSFLDVGCGNGWVVRMMADDARCKRAVGIDASRKMVELARKRSDSERISYVRTRLESWRTRSRFDAIFSMESIYYAVSVPAAVRKVYTLLAPGGRFFCGTDYYAENRATARWQSAMNLKMHSFSESEWIRILEDAGFRASATHITDGRDRRQWRRELGTLFVTGRKA